MNNVTEALDELSNLVNVRTKTMGVLAARALVLGKFFDGVMPHLTLSQRSKVSEAFRDGMEDVASMMEGVPLPAEYYSAMRELKDTIFASLKLESAEDR